MKITDHIHAIKIPFSIPVAPGRKMKRFVYSYLVFGSSVTLIDSGVAGSERIIYEYLRAWNKEPQDIRLLLLTHAHPDHIGAAARIKEQTKCLVYAHPLGKAWIEDVELQFSERPVPGFHTLVGGSVTVDRFLDDLEIIDLGEVSLQIYHTPGHSFDSISLYCPQDKVFFSGDAILQRNDLPIYEDAELLAASILKIKGIQEIKHLLSSWSDPVERDGVMRMLDNGLDHINTIHRLYRSLQDKNNLNDTMQVCSLMVEKLGLPEAAVNPIVAKSFASHLTVINQPELP